MGAFWTDAQGLFETARQAAHSGSPDCDLAILIGAEGSVRMLEAAGWALPSLAAEHGARTVYRVTRERGSVRLEGCSGSQSCLLGSLSHAETARALLSGSLPAEVVHAAAVRALLPAAAAPRIETWTVWA